MKTLTKILLINWHMFSYSEIEVDRNVLITGHNGAGKSTLLDAIQYVLTGGKTKFNLAANEGGTRKLESYIRGKLGTEAKENIRSGDVVTHIALQFYDEEEKRPFIIGAVIDLPDGGKPIENFYLLSRQEIRKGLYIEGNTVLDSGQFKRRLMKEKYKVNFATSKADARKQITLTFGLGRKYIDLIPKALAFKPINDLNDFMFQFLLPEERINIDDLRQNIIVYRHLEENLNEQQERLNILEKINDERIHYQKTEEKKKIYDYISGLILLNSKTIEKEKLKNHISEDEHTLSNQEYNENRVRQKQKTLNTQIAEVAVQLNALDPKGLIATLRERKKSLESSFDNQKRWLNKTMVSVRNDSQLLGKLSVKCELPDHEEALLNNEGVSDQFLALQKRVDTMKMDVISKEARTKIEKDDVQDKIKEINEVIELLDQKKYPYRKEVQALIELLRKELSKAAGKTIDVRPFCEYLEITDDTWRNAAEGYLNTQRFDLFVEPQYFNNAARIYEQFKNEYGIYGVGIVNTGAISAYDETPAGTLAEKVASDNIYARRYANMILGKVVCVDSVKQLSAYKQAITKTCMVYRNFTVRAIHPNVYMKPYIGQRALQVQMENAKQELDELRVQQRNINARETQYERQKEYLKEIDLSYGRTFAIDKETYLSVKADFHDTSEKLKQLEKDPSWITLTTQQEDLEKELAEVTEELSKIQSSIAGLKSELERTEEEYYDLEQFLKTAKQNQDIAREEILDLMKEVDETYAVLKKNARSEFGRMEYQNNQNKKDAEELLRQIGYQITDQMHIFNVRTQFGLEESLEAMKDYMAQYDKLRSIEIENTKNRTIEARMKCEKSFQEDFISSLRNQIDEATNNLNKLNKALADKNFQGDRYSFTYSSSKDPVFAQYYKILQSKEDFAKDTIFMEELSEHNRQLMDELFTRLVVSENNETNEKVLQEYTDYRKYMSYDIKITHENGDVTYFSKVNKEKSGGETQTPYYVIIAASFDQLATRKDGNNGCLVLFDEAFNNMDENRIEALMKFYRSLNIQLMIAVPEGRVRNIIPYVETSLLLVKKDNRIHTKAIINESESRRDY